MFGSTVLEVAIGMTFCYAWVALLVSTIQEAIAWPARRRPRSHRSQPFTQAFLYRAAPLRHRRDRYPGEGPGGPRLLQVAGWVITASSALFGAPFWFDLLQRLVQVRCTGQKPGEKKD